MSRVIKMAQEQVRETTKLRDNIYHPNAKALFVRQATPGTTYWRLEVPASRLPANVIDVQPDYIVKDENVKGPQPYRFLPWDGEQPIIWQFLGDNNRSKLAWLCKDQGAKTLLEIDDEYLYGPPASINSVWSKTKAEAEALLLQGVGAGYSYEKHREIVPYFDSVIASTEYLANMYVDFGHPDVHVCRNSVAPEDWTLQKIPDLRDPDVLRIVYYASGSHMHDWPLVKKAMKYANAQKDVEVTVMGFEPPGWSGPVAPWRNSLEEARAELGKYDVGIAPIKGNPWTRCKSDIKFMEYAMAGVMPIASWETPYDYWQGKWDFLPRNADEWMEQIRYIVKNRDIVKGKAAEAKAMILAERTIDHEVHKWEEAIS